MEFSCTYVCRFFNRLYAEYQQLCHVKMLQLEASNPNCDDTMVKQVTYVFVIHIRMYVCTYMCVHVCVHMCVCACVCTCVFVRVCVSLVDTSQKLHIMFFVFIYIR